MLYCDRRMEISNDAKDNFDQSIRLLGQQNISQKLFVRLNHDITIREMMEDSTATGIILKANEPWREAKTKLYYDFLQSMQAHFSEAQVFDTIADFIQNCTDTLDIVRGIVSNIILSYCNIIIITYINSNVLMCQILLKHVCYRNAVQS